MEKPVKKAYKINLDRIEEGYLYSEYIVHADKLPEARSLLFKEVKYDGMKLRWSDDEITYLTIPVVRAPNGDLYEFEGTLKSKGSIGEIQAERERIVKLNNILADETIQYCYIQKGSYYCPDMCGYTQYQAFAGVYSKEEAVQHVKSVRNASAIPIDIDEHNRMLNERIQDLQTRLI